MRSHGLSTFAYIVVHIDKDWREGLDLNEGRVDARVLRVDCCRARGRLDRRRVCVVTQWAGDWRVISLRRSLTCNALRLKPIKPRHLVEVE